MTVFHCASREFCLILESDGAKAPLSVATASCCTPELQLTDYNHLMRNLTLTCIFLITACAPTPKQSAIDISLESYIPSTPSVTSTPNVIVIAQTPLPSATASIYIVEAGDTLSEIAEKFKISQDDLRAANPDVSPNSMSIGLTLIIPDPSSALAGASTQITLLDENNNVVASQVAFTLLDIIPPNSSMPVYVFFPDTSANGNVQ